MIYLASPYSHPKKYVRDKRYKEITKIGAILISQGHCIHGPITESHCYTETGIITETGWDFWKKKDLTILAACDELWVITLPGWRESKGVTAEIAYATERGIPISYFNSGEITE